MAIMFAFQAKDPGSIPGIDTTNKDINIQQYIYIYFYYKSEGFITILKKFLQVRRIYYNSEEILQKLNYSYSNLSQNKIRIKILKEIILTMVVNTNSTT